MSTLSASITVDRGTFVLEAALDVDARGLVLIGPNGAGKTTLLLTLLGICRPRTGRITLANETLFDATNRLDLPPEDRRIAYVPQDYALFPHLDAAANVAFALEAAPSPPPRSERRARTIAALDAVGLVPLANRRPAALSGGERQRVALARALVANPRALLLDEPLAALDAATRADVRTFLRDELRALARPFIVVTHDPADAESLDAPIAVLDSGRLIQQGTTEALRQSPATPFISKFLSR